MLSQEENDLLTRVGPGTPMGELLRRYWAPALLSEELGEPDGAPVRVRLMGEDLVAFRDSAGAVGLIQERCPHRGASLAYGRNEDGGLRCIYHGWKFDTAGACLDLPTEPAGSPFQQKLRATAYPAREAAGVVWAYLGPEGTAPPFPAFEWTQLPQAHRKVWKISQECNYLQMVERDIDSAHISVLHRRLGKDDEIRGTLGDGELPASALAKLDRADTAPRIEIESTAYGFRYAALRSVGGGEQTARIYPFVYPWHPFIPPFRSGYRVTHAFVPRDDTTSWHYLVCYHPDEPIDAEHYERTRGLRLKDHHKVANHRNRYLQDREAMRQDTFSGIEGVIIEDHAIVEMQGPIAERTAEHLGSTDVAIVLLRHQLLTGIEAVQRGEDPPGLGREVPYERISGENLRIPESADWREASPLDEAFRVDTDV